MEYEVKMIPWNSDHDLKKIQVIWVFCTYIRQVKGAIGVEDNREDGEDELEDSKLEGAQFEQEEIASGVGEEEKELQLFSRNMINYDRKL